MASTDARPVPRKNVAYRVTFPILDADGDLVTGASGLDSEVSKDGGTFADCTNEATEIATSSGMYYLDLTSTEMNADTVAIIVKTSTSGAKTTVLVLYPEESGDYRADVVQWNGTNVASPNTAGYPVVTVKDGTGTGEIDTTSGKVALADGSIGSATFASGAINAAALAADAIGAAELAADAVAEIADAVWDELRSGHVLAGSFGQALQAAETGTAQSGSTSTTIKLRSGASASDDAYNGLIVVIVAGTGVNQAAIISDYTGTTKVATISSTWSTTPDSTSVYAIIGV